MKQIKIISQRGILLLEIVIGLLVLSILLPQLVPNWPEIVGRNISERAIEETLTIWDASRNYYARNSEWPDESNNCADALTVLEAGDFIGNVGPNNAWDGAIATSCVPDTAILTISQPVIDDWQGYIAGQLTATKAVGTTTIETVVPAPGTSAQTQTQLSRIAVPGAPELNRMETDLDMDSNAINNASEITADKVTVNDELTHATTGDRMANFGTWDRYNNSSAWTNGQVPYESCPAGTSPRFNAIPENICTDPAGTLPIERWDFDVIDTGTGWRIRPVIFAQNAFYRPTANVCSTFKVQTYCR